MFHAKIAQALECSGGPSASQLLHDTHILSYLEANGLTAYALVPQNGHPSKSLVVSLDMSLGIFFVLFKHKGVYGAQLMIGFAFFCSRHSCSQEHLTHEVLYVYVFRFKKV